MYMEKSLNLGKGLASWLDGVPAFYFVMSREERSHSLYFPIRNANLLKVSALCLQCKWFLLVTVISCFATPNIIIPFSNNGDLDLAWSKALLQMSVPGSVVEPSSTFDAVDD